MYVFPFGKFFLKKRTQLHRLAAESACRCRDLFQIRGGGGKNRMLGVFRRIYIACGIDVHAREANFRRLRWRLDRLELAEDFFEFGSNRLVIGASELVLMNAHEFVVLTIEGQWIEFPHDNGLAKMRERTFW